ncbi:hypothetical protein M9Y10_017183 [Tritrichomonas musculus]|uniref:Uncharacterized protein n=1 Tax=Tritrichomonas musculus TaxID=1915356 RepID=A0ABR2HVP6_9EUKA
MTTRGFTSSSGKAARKKQLDDKNSYDEISRLEKKIVLLQNISNSYKRKYIEASKELDELRKSNKLLSELKKRYPFLHQHLFCLNLSNTEESAENGKRFEDDLIPIFMLLSTAGEYLVNLLHKYFGFSCYKTWNNYKKKFKDQYGITDDIFNGSYLSINRLIKLFWKSEEDNKCIVAVDAASVKAKMTLHKDGTVEGLMHDLKIDLDDYDLITTNLDAYYSFFELHRDEIVKYYFVFYVCSLNNENKSFPICLKKKENGSANLEITQILEEVSVNCIHAGLDVIGFSFDGDPSYLKYVDEMIIEITDIAKLDLKKPLSNLFSKYSGLLIFEDRLHLVKCSRYRLSSGSQICSSLSDDEHTFSVEDFKSIGIKDYLLDNSKAKKMDDALPILFFSKENIELALNAHRYDILLAMLPSFLLIDSLFSNKITRFQRIEQLTFGCSLVLTYYIEYTKYDFDNGLQRRNKDKGKNMHMTLHDPIWAKKYISLTISLVKVLSDQRNVHLGSCGSHFLEHFFGMVRRFCKGNDSALSIKFYKKIIFKTLMFNLAVQTVELGLNLNPKKLNKSRLMFA